MIDLVAELSDRLPEIKALSFRAEIEPMSVAQVRRDFYDPFGALESETPGRSVGPTPTSGSLADVYLRLLEVVGAGAAEIGDGPIAAHWPFVGSSYRGLVIVGQALQGWDAPDSSARFLATQATSDADRLRILGGIQGWARSRPEPMADVLSRGHRSGSPFWTVSRHLVNVLEPDGAGQWFGRYAWWNIYPLGWDEPDSGPTGALKDAQTPLVGELFWAAMDEVGADRIVLVAGRSMWWEIRGLLGLRAWRLAGRH